MNKKQIIDLWRTGYSKKYICELHYNSIKKNLEYQNTKAKIIRNIAYNDVEQILLEEYKKNKG